MENSNMSQNLQFLTREKLRSHTTQNKTVGELFDELSELFDLQQKEIERLRKENARLMNGIFEKSEMKKLTEEYKRMEKDLYRGFPISEDEDSKIQEFIKFHKGDYGAIGGAFEYRFVPTSIGTSGRIIAPNGDEMEFQEIN